MARAWLIISSIELSNRVTRQVIREYLLNALGVDIGVDRIVLTYAGQAYYKANGRFKMLIQQIEYCEDRARKVSAVSSIALLRTTTSHTI